jgi:hypothetical protein
VSRVLRLDLGTARLRDDLKTVQGGARIPSRLSRIGVQNYETADGKVLREYRPPSEVFALASLKSFETATLTIGHPGQVTSDNWKALAVGFALNPHAEDSRYVGADLVLQDAEALRRANLPASAPDALVELSCGYDCVLEMTSGTSPEGEKYDAVQRAIVVNHIGLGPKDWGRAGNEVKLKLDGGAFAVTDSAHRKPSPLLIDGDLLLFALRMRAR